MYKPFSVKAVDEAGENLTLGLSRFSITSYFSILLSYQPFTSPNSHLSYIADF
jgi:hypothetical protein